MTRICCIDDMQKHLRDVPKPTVPLNESFVLTNPRKRSHGDLGDCCVLSVAIVMGWNYEATGRLMSPFFDEHKPGIFGIRAGDFERVLKRLGFHPVWFDFPISLADLWDTGFWELQKSLRRVGIVAVKTSRGAHNLGFIHGRFYGDFLNEYANVMCVFLRQQKDGSAVV